MINFQNIVSLIDLFRKNTSIALAETAPSGVILDANAGFLRLFPGGAAGAEVAGYFFSPSFSRLNDLSRSSEQPFYEGLLTIGERDGKLRTLRGAVSRSGRGFAFVLEQDIEELENVWQSAVALSNDLAMAQRELLTLNHRLKLREEAITAMALTDQLTGLANRRKLEEVYATESNRVLRYGSPLSVALADVDFFKRVNDQFGHQVGDSVLQAVATIVQANLRETDLAARYGGEEFALLLPGTDLHEAITTAERIRHTIEHASFPCLPGPLTVSIGVAEMTPGETAMAIFKRADDALYQAKRRGRNRVECDGTVHPAAEPLRP